MNSENSAKILDITDNKDYEPFLYRCFVLPSTKYRKRREYLEQVISKGFHKKILILRGEVVGQIEYGPIEVSGFPITGNKIIVMNCIWVLRKAKGHNYGKLLFNGMIENGNEINGIVTIALENHWSPWLKRRQLEKFNFISIDSIEVRHLMKHQETCFKIHLMWYPLRRNAEPPIWNKQKLLQGLDFCLAHPLYHPDKIKQKNIFKECK